MPTKKIYNKVIEASVEIEKLGLDGWITEFTITDKKGNKTDVKVSIKLKKRKNSKGVKATSAPGARENEQTT